MRRIILVGYMGSGKTTIGKALSKETGMMFYDLDWYIESRMHKTVSQIFAERGEEAFRKMEYNMLHEVAEFEDVIISCGGGTPCFFDNMDYLSRQGDVVYLKASPDTLYKHLLMAKVERPLLKDKTQDELIDYITTHLAEREPYYQKAHHVLNVDVLDNYDKIKDSVAQLRQMLDL
ncbi:MAG: shikimate kinase [Prevotella sp.]|nr:shikimate kinase [Prevotella sp.]